jgi:hypothetical protein
MTWSFVKNSLKTYDSSNSQFESSRDLVIYLELSSCISVYLRIDFIQNKHQSLSDFTAFNKADDAEIFWNIKNIKQLSQWIEEDSNWFLEVLNDFQRQWDLDIETCDLFDKISSEQIWKTCYKKIDRVKILSDKVSQKI